MTSTSTAPTPALDAWTALGEVRGKEVRIRALMEQRGIGAVVLRRVSSFAWATAGAASYVNVATDEGEGVVVFTPRGRHVVTTVIEAERLRDEEGLGPRGFEVVARPWQTGIEDGIDALTSGLSVATDVHRPGQVSWARELAALRAELGPAEVDRFRVLGRRAADAIAEAAERVRPGMSEHEIAAALAGSVAGRGVLPIVVQVAADGRAERYRHALPTDARLERYVILSFCGRRHGLVCSLTRALHFGPLPDALRRKQEVVAGVEARVLAACREGSALGEVFAEAALAYAEAGFPGEELRHHQGGLAGYEPREALAAAGSSIRLRAGQVVAFNPTVSGAKSEDTALLTRSGVEILTSVGGWPVFGGPTARPGIRVLT